jgi:uncharacterized protein YndB with AHSA1/START domain
MGANGRVPEEEPMDINRAAPVITRDEILIEAPMETIWDIHTDVAAWPSWQPEVNGAQAEGPLAVGSVFRWQTAGLEITSTVEEVDAPYRIVWAGPAQGIVAVHVWTLDPQADGVLVRTEESWEGEPIHAQVEAMQGLLDGSLRNWLESLKRTAEDRARSASSQ